MRRRSTLHLLSYVLLFACIAPAQQAPAPRRPLSAPTDAKLFKGKWYAVITDKVSWSSARDKCARMGGQLVVIPDEATWTFVKALPTGRVWLGATDDKVEGEWLWVDGSKMTFSAWAPNNPSNDRGREHYMTTTPGQDNQWNDAPKDWDAYEQFPVVGYICEWKAR